MKTQLISVRSLVAAGILAACSSPSVEPPPTVHLAPHDFELVSSEVLIGQDAIDSQRAQIERDLERVLAIDPDHSAVAKIRQALADLEWEERQLHWRISRGFTNPDGTAGDGPQTLEEFWRAFIEDREMLQLTDSQVRAAEAHLTRILRDAAADTDGSGNADTLAVSAVGGSVLCTTNAVLTAGNAGSDL